MDSENSPTLFPRPARAVRSSRVLRDLDANATANANYNNKNTGEKENPFIIKNRLNPQPSRTAAAAGKQTDKSVSSRLSVSVEPPLEAAGVDAKGGRSGWDSELTEFRIQERSPVGRRRADSFSLPSFDSLSSSLPSERPLAERVRMALEKKKYKISTTTHMDDSSAPPASTGPLISSASSTGFSILYGDGGSLSSLAAGRACEGLMAMGVDKIMTNKAAAQKYMDMTRKRLLDYVSLNKELVRANAAEQLKQKSLIRARKVLSFRVIQMQGILKIYREQEEKQKQEGKQEKTTTNKTADYEEALSRARSAAVDDELEELRTEARRLREELGDARHREGQAVEKMKEEIMKAEENKVRIVYEATPPPPKPHTASCGAQTDDFSMAPLAPLPAPCECASLRRSLSDLEAANSLLSSRNQRLVEERIELNIVANTVTANDGQRARMEKQLIEEKQRAYLLEEELTQVRARLAAARQLAEERESESSERRLRVSQLERLLDGERTTVKRLQEEYQVAGEQRNAIRAAMEDQSRLTVKKSEYEALDEKFRRATREIGDLQEEINKARMRIEEINDRRGHERAEAEQRERTMKEQREEERRRMADEADAERRRAEALENERQEVWKKKEQEMTQEIQQLIENKQQLQAACETLESSLADSAGRLAAADELAATHAAHAHRLAEQLDELRSAMSAIEADQQERLAAMATLASATGAEVADDEVKGGDVAAGRIAADQRLSARLEETERLLEEKWSEFQQEAKQRREEAERRIGPKPQRRVYREAASPASPQAEDEPRPLRLTLEDFATPPRHSANRLPGSPTVAGGGVSSGSGGPATGGPSGAERKREIKLADLEEEEEMDDDDEEDRRRQLDFSL